MPRRLSLRHIGQLGFKEFRSLSGDMAMMFLVVFMFTGSVYSESTAKPESLNRATIAVVDEDRSQLSTRIIAALHPPQFIDPQYVDLAEMDRGMDAGRHTFVLDIPPNFERDVLAGRAPALQLNVDATRLSQAQTGTGYVQNIVGNEVQAFVQRSQDSVAAPLELVSRSAFNPNLQASWFTAITAIINNVTMLGILLTGAALIREREHGTLEHLLVMPVTPLEIMLSKIWSMGVVVVLASSLSLQVMVKGLLGISVVGSATLFGFSTLLYLFAAASIGIYMGTLARSMPQFGLMSILVLLPLEILSGATTPRESMPEQIQYLMSFAPTTHYVALAQSILFRGAGLSVVWPQLLMVAAIGAVFFALALRRLRRTIGAMQS
ncbi:ABC transporter permease [Plasticicumulans acidivorans]|uniref:ABC-2 type transport system permease protein n=1 Tax=Plasticicumulans acidivorans TaxID=886464 RepID=A0A317MV76_9GAMM|nr:ABC transporter permease [Plasticicumulans acidivorans]PWV61213.1 ABC-2 type transport system permease protein [Plasticicumulans acidivorans]